MAHYCFYLFSTCLKITKLLSVWGFTSLDPTTHGEKPVLLRKTKNRVLRKALPWTKSFWLQDVTIWGMFLAHCLWSTIISFPSWSLKKCPTTPKSGYLRGVGPSPHKKDGAFQVVQITTPHLCDYTHMLLFWYWAIPTLTPKNPTRIYPRILNMEGFPFINH